MSHHRQQERVVELHNFLNNPSSLFEHKIFTALGLFMRNLTEQFQDYRGYYYALPDNFFNGLNTTIHLEDETDSDDFPVELEPHQFSDFSSEAVDLSEILVTLLCILTATWLINKSLLRNRLIQFGIELITCYLIILPALPFIGSFYALIGLCRLGMWIHIQLFHRGKWYLARPEDAFWAYEKFASSSSSTCLYVIQGKCDLKKIREKVIQVVKSPVVNGKMSLRLTNFCGFPVWEKVDSWNVNNHVIVAKWPKSDKRSKDTSPWSEKDVFDYLSTFQDKPISNRKSAWEVVVIPSVKQLGSTEPHYVCIFRMHHGLMDGISSANILHQSLADKSFKFTVDPLETNAKNKPGSFMTFCMYFMALFLLPRTGLVTGLLNLDNQHNRYFSPGKTLKGPKHFAWSRPLKMTAIKKIKDETKTSVMSVLFSTLGGSYRRMEEVKNGPKYCKNLPEFYHGLTPVAMLPYPDRHPRNGFSGAVFPVAVGEFATPLDRLRVNHKAVRELGYGVMEIMGYFILINMVGLMPTFMQKLFQGAVHFKLSMSNIPGSDEEVMIFGGDRIVDMGAWLPCKFTLGMAMGLFSYGGRCRATIVGDHTYFSKSDVGLVTKNIEAEITNLGKMLGMTEDEIFC